MTNLVCVDTPRSQSVCLSLSLAHSACFIICLNKTQPAKMAKAMNSFGFPLSISLALSVTPPLHSTLCWLIECT